ncbi:MAG: DUF58 domain-containing protein, partial [Polyangiaceae bacterium]
LGRGDGDEFLGLKVMRTGEDPRDVHWRKSAAAGQLVLRERAHEARPEVKLSLDVLRPQHAKEDWDIAFEKRVRDIASRAVAHLKRGDSVSVITNAGGHARGDRAVGADPLLRYLALVQSSIAPESAPAPASSSTPEAAE